jgi:hypothetical protein
MGAVVVKDGGGDDSCLLSPLGNVLTKGNTMNDQEKIKKLEGEASVMRAILRESDSVLSSIEPDDTDEAQALGELRRKIKAVLFPDADLSLF